jgi:hypothetical protein
MGRVARRPFVHGFLSLSHAGAANGSHAACGGATRCPGFAQQEAALFDQSTPATAVASGCGVHAGHDPASWTSSGDDRDDSIAHGEQGSPFAGCAYQQLAV